MGGPGPGLGGHCIPVDPHYLAWSAKHHKTGARLINLASEINESMPKYVVNKIVKALKQILKPINGAKILILGVAYKRDISDTRESPAKIIMQLLEERGSKVAYHDPYVPQIKIENGNFQTSQELTVKLLKKSDCIVVITDHTCIDYQLVVDHSKIVVDTRNATSTIVKKSDSNIMKI